MVYKKKKVKPRQGLNLSLISHFNKAGYLRLVGVAALLWSLVH